jgi:glutamate synthase domain-containing protein 1
MVFLPRKNLEEQEFCRTVMESEIAAAGLHALGWRQVPINTQMVGEKAADHILGQRLAKSNLQPVMAADWKVAQR